MIANVIAQNMPVMYRRRKENEWTGEAIMANMIK